MLSQKDFCDGLALLNYGSLEEKITIVFKMLDFAGHGAIMRPDCRAILAHIPVLLNPADPQNAQSPIGDVAEK